VIADPPLLAGAVQPKTSLPEALPLVAVRLVGVSGVVAGTRLIALVYAPRPSKLFAATRIE